MELLKNTATRFGSLLAVACIAFLGAMTFSSCSDEEELDEDGYRTFNSAFDLNFTRIERVGSVLIADFTLENKSGKTIKDFKLLSLSATDNQGEAYSSINNDMRYGNGAYSDSRSITLGKDETVTGTFRIGNFDTSDSAEKISFSFRCVADEANINPYTDVATADFRISDNRVLNRGIQTNDLGLNYDLEDAYQDGTNVYLTFSLTNNTGIELSDLYLNPREVNDNNGDNYNFYVGIAAGNSADYSGTVTIPTVGRGAKVTFTLKVTNVRTQVSSMSAGIQMYTPSYEFADETLRLINIPVSQRR